MVRAKVTQAFDGVEDGTVYPRVIEVGEEISGSLAEAAIAEKWAKETKESRAERSLLDEEAEQAAAEQKAKDDAAAAAKARYDENIAKLALLTHDQLAAIATEHSIDISTARSEADVIDAVERGLEALNLDIPAPAVTTTA